MDLYNGSCCQFKSNDKCSVTQVWLLKNFYLQSNHTETIRQTHNSGYCTKELPQPSGGKGACHEKNIQNPQKGRDIILDKKTHRYNSHDWILDDESKIKKHKILFGNKWRNLNKSYILFNYY